MLPVDSAIISKSKGLRYCRRSGRDLTRRRKKFVRGSSVGSHHTLLIFLDTQQADQARAPIPDTYLPRAPSYCAPKDPGGTLTSELQQEHSSDVLLVSDDEDFTVDDGPTIVDDGDTGQQREEEAEIHISTNTDPAEYVLRTGGQPSRSATFISKHGWGSSNLLEISTDSDTDVSDDSAYASAVSDDDCSEFDRSRHPPEAHDDRVMQFPLGVQLARQILPRRQPRAGPGRRHPVRLSWDTASLPRRYLPG